MNYKKLWLYSSLHMCDEQFSAEWFWYQNISVGTDSGLEWSVSRLVSSAQLPASVSYIEHSLNDSIWSTATSQ